MYKYKNKTDRPLVLIGIGTVAASQEFTHNQIIENPNVEYIGTVENSASVTGVQEPQPTAVTEAKKIDNEETE